MEDKRTVSSVANRLETHEQICAERYTNIWIRLGRLEKVVLASAAAIIGLLVSLVIKGM